MYQEVKNANCYLQLNFYWNIWKISDLSFLITKCTPLKRNWYSESLLRQFLSLCRPSTWKKTCAAVYENCRKSLQFSVCKLLQLSSNLKLLSAIYVVLFFHVIEILHANRSNICPPAEWTSTCNINCPHSICYTFNCCSIQNCSI